MNKDSNRVHLPFSKFLMLTIVLSSVLSSSLNGEDWPEWRGEGRLGIWAESGILDKFRPAGLEFKWRTPIKAGFSGPAVSQGRVFVFDYEQAPGTRLMEGKERLVCLDERTGDVLWTHEWETHYRQLMASYATGPRSTPTVDGDRVYVVGATGVLRCLKTDTGKLIWGKDYVRDYKTKLPTWGVASSPLVDDNRLICIVGGEPDAKVVAFDKLTGKEIWRALSSDWEMGYGQPVIFTAGGTRQLIIWHPKALSSLNPETGETFWEEPFDVRVGMTVATPVKSGPYLLVSQFYGGSMMMDLSAEKPLARIIWKGKSKSELPDKTDGLHALIVTPIIQDDHIYGVCSYGQLRCLSLRTGRRIWETTRMTESARWATAFMVRNGDRYFVNNDKGDLIIAQFTPEGYTEIDRTPLIEPTSECGYGASRRFGRTVNWAHPAYANRHVFARNDREILAASLADK